MKRIRDVYSELFSPDEQKKQARLWKRRRDVYNMYYRRQMARRRYVYRALSSPDYGERCLQRIILAR
jgi:hypothetical protein